MANEKFLNNENASVLWDKIKEYIQTNTAMINGGFEIELDKEVFGEPPYTLKISPDENVENSGGGG